MEMETDRLTLSGWAWPGPSTRDSTAPWNVSQCHGRSAKKVAVRHTGRSCAGGCWNRTERNGRDGTGSHLNEMKSQWYGMVWHAMACHGAVYRGQSSPATQ